MVNDVSGLNDPLMQQLVRESGCQAVAMHSVTIPVEPGKILAEDESAVSQVEVWLARQLDQWNNAGLDLNKIIIDPGIGFGKTQLQSLELLQNCAAFMASGLRLLVGHSRKSFMSGFTDRDFGERDLETLGVSLALCHQGVDIIRVHDPVMHMRAYRAWSHVAG